MTHNLAAHRNDEQDWNSFSCGNIRILVTIFGHD